MSRAAFVYPNPRGEAIAAARRGEAPSTHLYALDEVAGLGIAVEPREPPLGGYGGAAARLVWHLREPLLAWQLRGFDVAFTPLANILPLATAIRRRPRVLVFNFGLNTIFRRAGRRRVALLRASLRRAAGVVCLGESQREELIELARLDPGHVHTVVHGVDHRYFAPREDVEPEPGLVVAVGKDLARDYRTLTAAADGLDARVVLVTLRRNLEGIRLPANVEVRERISDDDVRNLYARASCVALPLRSPAYEYGSEGSGITTLLEAEAMARPVVLSERPVFRDYVRHGENALVVPPEDPAALRDAIAGLLASPERARALAAEARATVERRHTMLHMAEQLAPLLRAAAAR